MSGGRVMAYIGKEWYPIAKPYFWIVAIGLCLKAAVLIGFMGYLIFFAGHP